MKIPLIWLKDYVETTKSIKELSADFTQLGLMLDKPLDETNVMDLEQRLNRSDLLSMLGCARDLAAFEGVKLTLPKTYTKPGLKSASDELIKVNVESKVVRRFQTRIFRGIKVGPSPKWLVDRLSAYGMDSINNIVDITNFVMIEYGQPMHAQDIAKLAGDLTIRPSKPGETITTLLGTEVELTKASHVITTGGEPIVILGVVGGKRTGVTSTTTDIVLDAGNYDSRSIRQSSRQLKIMNETVSRDDKFLDPRLIDFALDRATGLILELAGGSYYINDDYYPTPATPQTIKLRLSRLQLLSGMDLDLKLAKKILKSLEYIVIEEGSDTLTLEVPYFRTDIEVEDDLVSDILRIHNYENIPLIALSTPVPNDITDPIYRFEDRLRDLLVAQGAHEHITNSLTQSEGRVDQVVLVNALTSDQNALRTDLIPGLTHVLSTYKKHKLSGIKVFELGKVFRRNEQNYLEGRLLTVMADANSLATLMSSHGIKNYTISKALEIIVAGKVIGSITPTSYTLVTTALLPHTVSYTGIVSDFGHTTSQDLSLLVPTKVIYADILTIIDSLKGDWLGITCKSMTKMDDKINNYLLTLTWEADSKNIDTDKSNIIATLKSKLAISSKS